MLGRRWQIRLLKLARKQVVFRKNFTYALTITIKRLDTRYWMMQFKNEGAEYTLNDR